MHANITVLVHSEYQALSPEMPIIKLPSIRKEKKAKR